MSSYLGSLKRNLVGTAVVSGLVLALGVGYAAAQSQPSTGDIVHALTPKPLTRSLSVSPEMIKKQQDDAKFVDGLKDRRSLTVGEREKVAVIAQDKPKIDLEVNFDFGSARIAKSAMPTVDALAKALNDPALKGSTFVVAGYTDAKGSEDYNQNLSERRANAVKNILVSKYGIAASTLVATGYGKTHLKNPSDPYGGENRRVGVVNMVSEQAKN
jgi:outer membrane protein OmpA-like peptidoglycan-associated protein